MPTRISRNDIADADIVDAPELASNGLSLYKTGSVVFASGSFLTASFGGADDGFQDFDDPAGILDVLVLSGSGNSDGAYTISGSISESIIQIFGLFTGSVQGGTHSGSWSLYYQTGGKTVGLDYRGLSMSSSVPSEVGSYARESTYQRLLEDEPAGIGVNEALLRTGNRVDTELWKRAADNSLIKRVDYTYSGNSVIQEVRKVYAEDGTTVVAQKTVLYTYSGNTVIATSSSRDV